MKRTTEEKLCCEEQNDFLANANIEYKAAIKVLARKISKVSRLYCKWMCPSVAMYRKCRPKVKTTSDCAKCITDYAIHQARKNIKRKKMGVI